MAWSQPLDSIYFLQFFISNFSRQIIYINKCIETQPDTQIKCSAISVHLHKVCTIEKTQPESLIKINTCSYHFLKLNDT